MQPHPIFDLYLHTDVELAQIWGQPIVTHRTLQEWPLSCVQEITGGTGEKRIYKAQRTPSLEHRVYALAHSPLLVQAETLYAEGDWICLWLEYVETPALSQQNYSAQGLWEIGWGVSRAIAEMGEDLPIYLDAGSPSAWQAMGRETLRRLRQILERGDYTIMSAHAVDELARWLDSERINGLFDQECGYIHGDLSGENLFVTPSGWRVIDWQFPRLGPRCVDVATLLESMGVDPTAWTSPEAVQAMLFLRVRWLVDCTLFWFPAGRATYDRAVAQLTNRLLALG